MADSKDYKKWLEQATEYELGCASSLKHKDSGPTPTCFMAKHLAELCLKALFIFLGIEFARTHDIQELATLLEPRAPGIFDLDRELVALNEFALTTRYPGDFPEGFTWQDAQEAYEAAVKIKEFVMSKINSVNHGTRSA